MRSSPASTRCRRSRTAASAAASLPRTPLGRTRRPHCWRRCAEILTRLRKSKNSVWLNSPVDVEGLKLHDYTDTRVRFAERARRRPWQGRPSAMAGGDGGTRKQRGKGDAAVSPFYWGLGKCYWGLRKNIGEREIKNQSVGASFFTINPLY